MDSGENNTSSSHPRGFAPRFTCENGLVAKLLLDAHQLVVFRISVRSARCTCLDLSTAQSNSNVCYGGVFCLARPVGAHNSPAILLAEFHCLNCLRHRSNLVDF